MPTTELFYFVQVRSKQARYIISRYVMCVHFFGEKKIHGPSFSLLEVNVWLSVGEELMIVVISIPIG